MPKRFLFFLLITAILGGLGYSALRAVNPGDVREVRASLSVAELLRADSVGGFARALEPRPFRFPQDHGPHPPVGDDARAVKDVAPPELSRLEGPASTAVADQLAKAQERVQTLESRQAEIQIEQILSLGANLLLARLDLLLESRCLRGYHVPISELRGSFPLKVANLLGRAEHFCLQRLLGLLLFL